MGMLNRRRMMGGKSLPYDAEVEYLMSDGNAYIDTGIYGKCNFEIRAGIPREGSNISAIFGSRAGYQNNSLLILWGQDGRVNPERGTIRMDYWNTGFIFSTPSANDVMITYNGSTLSDGAQTLAISAAETPTFGSHYLFAINSNGSIIKALEGTYIRSAKIGYLDLIPVRVGTVGYLYDKVSGKLFGNAGTGDFILGPDKSGEDYSRQYLTFEVMEGGDVTFAASHDDYVKTIEYSLNGGNWVSVTSSTTPQQLGGILQAGDKVRVRGLNRDYFNNTVNKRNSFGGTAKVNVFGNIVSLTYGDDFINKTVPESNFACLFYAHNGLLSAECLVIPWDYIPPHGIKMMFHDCINLTTAPTIKGQLSTSNCCRQMFFGCSSLNKIACLATDISGAYATTLWVSGVAATGTFVKHPDATWSTGTSGIPNGWTVEDAVI